MKKQLLTTTALIAAGVVAASGTALAQKKAGKPTLRLGGFQEGIVGAASQDTDSSGIGPRVGFDVQHDAEIHFKGSVTLDNGVHIRTRVELEGASQGLGKASGGDQIDEAYVNVSGTFGAIRIGSDDNAAHLMVTPFSGSWATQVGQNLNFDTTDWIAVPSGFARSDVMRLSLGDADSEKVTYFTPRIEGLQLGVSYMPSFEEDANGSNAKKSAAANQGWAIGATYVRKFDKIGIGLAAGYATVNAKPGTDRLGDGAKDPKGYHIAGRLDYGPFRVAVGYLNTANERGSNPGVSGNSKEAIDTGVRYVWGKNKVSLTYAHGENEGLLSVAGNDTLDHGMLSYRRELGPGVQYRLNFMYANWDGEDAGSTDDNTGFAVTTSVRLAF